MSRDVARERCVCVSELAMAMQEGHRFVTVRGRGASEDIVLANRLKQISS